MAFNNQHYEIVYQIPLFDDLHNYCPDIIYNPGRFTSVNSLTQYISNCARERGNRFTAAQEHYFNRFPRPVVQQQEQQQQPQQQPQQPQPQPPQPTVNNIYNSLASTLYPPLFDRNRHTGIFNRIPRNIRPNNEPLRGTGGLYGREDRYTPLMTIGTYNDTNIFDSLLNIFSNTGTNPLATALLTPVVVRPTPEQITSATELLMVSEEDRFDNCSICVESINPNTEVRRINHCRHTFHRACIDTWFDRNVRCPNCRYDIRDNNVGHTTPAPTPTPTLTSTIGSTLQQPGTMLGIYYEIDEVNSDNDEYEEEDY